MSELLRKMAYWLLPCGLYKVYVKPLKTEPEKDKKALGVVRRNTRYHDCHKNKRCFIMCNGPTINKQNLLPLKDEYVFSVSCGYLHKDYSYFKPKYHCLPQLTYSEQFTKRTALEWFKEMESHLINTELFLSYTEYDLVKSNNLFSNIKVNYLYFNGGWNSQTNIMDISRELPGVQSVPIMCLMIAMYMGFKEIYLIGTEHDSFRTGDYKYFYNPTVLADTGFNIGESNKVKSLYEELRGSVILWDQYRALKKIAAIHNIKIYNATVGGALDEFERVKLENILYS